MVTAYTCPSYNSTECDLLFNIIDQPRKHIMKYELLLIFVYFSGLKVDYNNYFVVMFIIIIIVIVIIVIVSIIIFIESLYFFLDTSIIRQLKQFGACQHDIIH